MQSQRLIQHTGSAELTIKGKNLKDTLRLLHDGFEYTPLASTDDSVTFILGDNGTNRIYVNGEYSFGVQISGVVVPEELRQVMIAAICKSVVVSGGFERVLLERTDAVCINYAHKPTVDYPNFYVSCACVVDNFNATETEVSNATINDSAAEGTNEYRWNLTPIDPTKPIYISYKGVIIFVGNY